MRPRWLTRIATATLAVGSVIVLTQSGMATAQTDSSSRMPVSVSVELTTIRVARRPAVMQETARILKERLALYGDPEPSVRIASDDQLIVDVPAAWTPDEVRQLLGAPGAIDFREEKDTVVGPVWLPATAINDDGLDEGLTGAHFQTVDLVMDPTTLRPTIVFSLDDEGGRLMEQITQRLQGQRLGVFLDDEPLMTPTVARIITNQGRITGAFTEDEARVIIAQLRSDPLPAPVSVEILSSVVDP